MSSKLLWDFWRRWPWLICWDAEVFRCHPTTKPLSALLQEFSPEYLEPLGFSRVPWAVAAYVHITVGSLCVCVILISAQNFGCFYSCYSWLPFISIYISVLLLILWGLYPFDQVLVIFLALPLLLLFDLQQYYWDHPSFCCWPYS